jgi:hypothetical protein
VAAGEVRLVGGGTSAANAGSPWLRRPVQAVAVGCRGEVGRVEVSRGQRDEGRVAGLDETLANGLHGAVALGVAEHLTVDGEARRAAGGRVR